MQPDCALRICAGCLVEKPESAFYRDRGQGIARCKKCKRAGQSVSDARTVSDAAWLQSYLERVTPDDAVWRPIPDREGYYEVSNIGEVRSLWFKNGKASFKRATPHVLKPFVNADGYVSVRLVRNGDVKTEHVHRLVLLAFVGAPPRGHCAGHRDGNPTHNFVANLAWITYSQNNGADRWRHGTALIGRKNHNAKLTDADAIAIRAIWAAGGVTAVKLGARFGISGSVAHKVATYKAWRHVGQASRAVVNHRGVYTRRA